jgi:hypothetical protein
MQAVVLNVHRIKSVSSSRHVDLTFPVRHDQRFLRLEPVMNPSIFRTPDIGFSRNERLVGLHAQTDPESCPRKACLQYIQFRAQSPQRLRPVC